jgi:hypothetical protein
MVDAEPVSRILYGVAAVDGHSSRPAITGRLKRPTRKFDASSRDVVWCLHQDSFPIWSCSAWGLPCPGHYCPSGALLPHLFTLTSALRPKAVYSLWHFPSGALNGAIPDVIRHVALRSSDFPLSSRAAQGRPLRSRAGGDLSSTGGQRPSGPASATYYYKMDFTAGGFPRSARIA